MEEWRIHSQLLALFPLLLRLRLFVPLGARLTPSPPDHQTNVVACKLASAASGLRTTQHTPSTRTQVLDSARTLKSCIEACPITTTATEAASLAVWMMGNGSIIV